MTSSNDEFWGNSDDWPDAPATPRREPRAGAGKTVSKWWNKAVGGGSTASRQHGGSRPAAPRQEDLEDEPLSVRHSGEHPVVHRAPSNPPAHDTADDSGPHDSDDAWDENWEVEPEPAPRPGVDPLLARLGGAAIVLTLLVPLFLGVGSGDEEPAVGAEVQQPVITLVEPDDVLAITAPSDATTLAEPPATQTPAPELTATTPTIATTTASTGATTVAAPVATTPTAVADASVESTPAIATGALASNTAERVEQTCAIDYTVVAGDFWIRLADESGVPLAQLLDANDATVDTPLYPGSTICLPDGATVPSPPISAAPATTAPSTTAKPATTAAPTTAAPTTVKPVVTYPTPSAAAVQQIIRDVWPDELEDRAIEIADRESNFVATAQNSCCYGVFQLHWTAHKSWLTGLGITAPEQLFDVTASAYAAYALYQNSGGWGPWT